MPSSIKFRGSFGRMEQAEMIRAMSKFEEKLGFSTGRFAPRVAKKISEMNEQKIRGSAKLQR